MKFAICNETFQDWPFDKAFAYAAKLGYTGLEIAPFTMHTSAYEISPHDRHKVRRQADDNNLEIIGLHWLLAKTTGYYLTTPDDAIRHKTSDYLAELARLCHDLGGHVMVLGSPLQRNLLPGVTHEQAMELAADCLRRAMPTLAECGVTLAVEPLGPKDGTFLHTAQLGVQLCEMVGSPYCRLHLDCKAMATESKPIPQIIRESAPLLQHFHANDPNMRGPGMGELDFVPIFQTLAEIDYRGWVSVEVFDYAPGVEALASESIAYMRRCATQIGA
ncbi:MAG: sugar phosphate isomerase/epimerase family protein [Pirellulaceae bacterium]|nr:sugar phosphate isomerase/epimerase family protein [Pirellulaceae bacterium]